MRVAGGKESKGGVAMAAVKRWRASVGNSNKEGSSNGDKGDGQG